MTDSKITLTVESEPKSEERATTKPRRRMCTSRAPFLANT